MTSRARGRPPTLASPSARPGRPPRRGARPGPGRGTAGPPPPPPPRPARPRPAPRARLALRPPPPSAVRADAVVLAAGPWSPALASPAGVALDVRPSRGQLVMMRPRAAAMRNVLTWRGCYLVPKPDGTVVAGSTEEEAGFDDRPTVEGI